MFKQDLLDKKSWEWAKLAHSDTGIWLIDYYQTWLLKRFAKKYLYGEQIPSLRTLKNMLYISSAYHRTHKNYRLFIFTLTPCGEGYMNCIAFKKEYIGGMGFLYGLIKRIRYTKGDIRW